MQTVNDIQELVYLGYRRVLPSVTLSPWIECFWSVKTQLQQHYQEKLYPDGGSSLSFHFTGTAVGGWFSAVRKFHYLSFEYEVDSFGIRFKPGGAHALLGLPINEMVMDKLPAEDIPLQGVEKLFDSLATADFQSRINLTETWLLKQLIKQQPVSGPVQHLSQQLEIADVDLVSILNRMGLTRRQAQRYFHHQVGISPNQLKTLLRVKKARRQLKLNPEQLLVETALKCGYFDQSHFNHHFRKVTGYRPGEYKQKQQQRIINQEMIIQTINTATGR